MLIMLLLPANFLVSISRGTELDEEDRLNGQQGPYTSRLFFCLGTPEIEGVRNTTASLEELRQKVVKCLASIGVAIHHLCER